MPGRDISADDLLRGRLTRRAAYDRRILAMGEAGWYWHVYLDGRKVNGGLSGSREEARAAADSAVTADLHGEPLTCSGWPARAGDPRL